jgi:hypothetical protein
VASEVGRGNMHGAINARGGGGPRSGDTGGHWWTPANVVLATQVAVVPSIGIPGEISSALNSVTK